MGALECFGDTNWLRFLTMRELGFRLLTSVEFNLRLKLVSWVNSEFRKAMEEEEFLLK